MHVKLANNLIQRLLDKCKIDDRLNELKLTYTTKTDENNPRYASVVYTIIPTLQNSISKYAEDNQIVFNAVEQLIIDALAVKYDPIFKTKTLYLIDSPVFDKNNNIASSTLDAVLQLILYSKIKNLCKRAHKNIYKRAFEKSTLAELINVTSRYILYNSPEYKAKCLFPLISFALQISKRPKDKRLLLDTKRFFKNLRSNNK